MNVGIDPAPAKPSVLWFDTGPRSVAATEMVLNMCEVAQGGSVLVAWDAPLSFALTSFSDRVVDRVARRWVRAHATQIGAKAVSVLPFSSCPHWAITCAALGVPFGNATSTWKLVATPAEIDGPSVIEVHPALALAAWWVDRKIEGALPRYKANKAACALVVSTLELPPEAGVDDDALDAYVAYRLACDFRSGSARWVGSPAAGGYVMPNGDVADELRELVG